MYRCACGLPSALSGKMPTHKLLFQLCVATPIEPRMPGDDRQYEQQRRDA